MCRALNALIQSIICLLQVFIRIFMTILLMAENLIKMVLQTVYNFISFLLQMLSLVPVCLVFMLTSKLKCLLCGTGGGICPVNRGSGDCIMTALAFALLFYIFRWTGFLDKIFYNIGYAKIAGVKGRAHGFGEEPELLGASLGPDSEDPDSGTGVMFLDNENMLRDYEAETETETTTEIYHPTPTLTTRLSRSNMELRKFSYRSDTTTRNLTTGLYRAARTIKALTSVIYYLV